MNRTTIEWVRNPDGTQGYTWNPITGCLNNCSYCYARRLANGRLRARYLANDGASVSRGTESADPFAPRWWEQKLYEPSERERPSGIFVCNMGELFGPWLDREWTDDVLDIIRHCPQHRFYLLTKQPQELVKWSPFPENAWGGVSAWDYTSFVNACYALSLVRAPVKYISLEPLLSWRPDLPTLFESAGVSWVIIGAQTKPTVQPRREWVNSIIARAKAVGVAVFLKESLRYAYDGGWPQEPFFWHYENDPHGWNLLQEFPDGTVLIHNKAITRTEAEAAICLEMGLPMHSPVADRAVEASLPTIDEFIGSDPNFTGGMTTKDYIDNMRDDSSRPAPVARGEG